MKGSLDEFHLNSLENGGIQGDLKKLKPMKPNSFYGNSDLESQLRFNGIYY